MAGLIAGVANHEARRVYDKRVERARRAVADSDLTALGAQLCEAILVELWRARSITGFEAFAQHVIGVDPAKAQELAQQAAEQRGLALQRLPDVAVALWLRGEAALLERCPTGELSARIEGDRLRLTVDVPVAPGVQAADALAAVGRSAAGLARILLEKPRPK